MLQNHFKERLFCTHHNLPGGSTESCLCPRKKLICSPFLNWIHIQLLSTLCSMEICKKGKGSAQFCQLLYFCCCGFDAIITYKQSGSWIRRVPNDILVCDHCRLEVVLQAGMIYSVWSWMSGGESHDHESQSQTLRRFFDSLHSKAEYSCFNVSYRAYVYHQKSSLT